MYFHQLSPPVDHHHSSSLSSLFFSRSHRRTPALRFEPSSKRFAFAFSVFCLLTDTEVIVVKPLAWGVAATHLKFLSRASFFPKLESFLHTITPFACVSVRDSVFHRKQKIFFFFGWRLPLHTALGLVYWWGTLLLLAASKIKNRQTCNKNTLVAGVVMHGALHSQFLPDSLRYFQIWLLFCTQKYHNLKKWGLYRIHIHFPIAHTVRRKTMKSHAQRYDIIIRHGIIHDLAAN